MTSTNINLFWRPLNFRLSFPSPQESTNLLDVFTIFNNELEYLLFENKWQDSTFLLIEGEKKQAVMAAHLQLVLSSAVCWEEALFY